MQKINIINFMEHNMILSASGWRKVFAASGNEQDTTKEIGKTNTALCALIAQSFAEYMKSLPSLKGKTPYVLVGMDTRPTGAAISDVIVKVLVGLGLKVSFLGISSAPEIFTAARYADGFLYISASHNPVGHNGIKFGINDGGVLEGSETAKITASFKEKCASPAAMEDAQSLIEHSTLKNKEIQEVFNNSAADKKLAVERYARIMDHIVSGSPDAFVSEKLFADIREGLSCYPIDIVCDMNGSSRCLTIDSSYIPLKGLGFLPFNNVAGQIVHEIIPEPENLVHTAQKIQELQSKGNKNAVLGYMPDCDGDRGNIVYWDEKLQKAVPLAAQTVFALSVLAEITSLIYQGVKTNKVAVCVNCPTSYRIDELCKSLGVEVFRAEVGEANVVNLARKKRAEGYTVRILGEGSNGGNITDPSNVRDPVATVFAMVKLLALRKNGLYYLYLKACNKLENYRQDFTLRDIIENLPQYTTTGVSEERAIMKVKSADKGLLKEKFRQIFLNQWEEKKSLLAGYGILSFDAVLTNGTNELAAEDNWNNGNGGLKIRFFDADSNYKAFIWMRPSGTEPVFRVMCDVKGLNSELEHLLLDWERQIIQLAD